MQQITAAYAEQDLHTLLRLQLEWMHREDAGAGRLTSEKLRAYNEVLKEQADELALAIDALFIHPRYEPLMQEAGALRRADHARRALLRHVDWMSSVDQHDDGARAAARTWRDSGSARRASGTTPGAAATTCTERDLAGGIAQRLVEKSQREAREEEQNFGFGRFNQQLNLLAAVRGVPQAKHVKLVALHSHAWSSRNRTTVTRFTAQTDVWL